MQVFPRCFFKNKTKKLGGHGRSTRGGRPERSEGSEVPRGSKGGNVNLPLGQYKIAFGPAVRSGGMGQLGRRWGTGQGHFLGFRKAAREFFTPFTYNFMRWGDAWGEESSSRVKEWG